MKVMIYESVNYTHLFLFKQKIFSFQDLLYISSCRLEPFVFCPGDDLFLQCFVQVAQIIVIPRHVDNHIAFDYNSFWS